MADVLKVSGGNSPVLTHATTVRGWSMRQSYDVCRLISPADYLVLLATLTFTRPKLLVSCAYLCYHLEEEWGIMIRSKSAAAMTT